LNKTKKKEPASDSEVTQQMIRKIRRKIALQTFKKRAMRKHVG